MKMRQQEGQNDHANTVGECDVCGAEIYRFRGQAGDLSCDCGAIYNIFGQRLRDDLYTRRNPSDFDDDIGDLEGYEMMYAGDE